MKDKEEGQRGRECEACLSAPLEFQEVTPLMSLVN